MVNVSKPFCAACFTTQNSGMKRMGEWFLFLMRSHKNVPVCDATGAEEPR